MSDMNNISCGVIRDLLPSYTDKIASDDSVRLVEKHLAECEACRAYHARMAASDVIAADKTVRLDYLKKIRKRTDLKSAFCFLLLIITFVIFLGYAKEIVFSKIFFALIAVLLACNAVLFFHKHNAAAGKKNAAASVVSILVAVYPLVLLPLTQHYWITEHKTPFHIAENRLGPFIDCQLAAIMLIEIVLWLRELILHIKRAQFSIVTGSFAVIGFYTSLYYRQVLRQMTSLEVTMLRISRNAFLIIAEGIVFLFLVLIFEKLKSRK